MIKRVAAIDCGTNSLRLLIADVDRDRRVLADVQRRMEIVRLGQGVDATGRLAPEALERTMKVLSEYAAAIGEAGAEAVRMVATSATRDASNAADFTRGVHETLGIEPVVITGAEEARLSFAGATAELAGAVGGPGPLPQPPYLVVDIGGGSTEFVLGPLSSAGHGPSATSVPQAGNGAATGTDIAGISVDIGCVRLTERHLRSDPPTLAQIEAASADIDAALEQVAEAVAVRSANTLVGLAGSVTTVTSIALGLPEYDSAKTHHARIPASDVHEVTQRLLSETREQRAAIPTLHPGRVDVIGAGALVLDRVLLRFGFADYVTSEHDILDGIAWSIAGD
jgi:exopolyphosphatase / guanosine-5'-triphosphate,3'-diphosphate pyrophosphatase